MSWLYRPTPVVPMGRGAFASQNVAPGWNGARMSGVLHGWNYAPGLGKAKAAKTGGRQPWIKLSGTMGDFIPNGLGGLGDDIPTTDMALPDTLTDSGIVPIDTTNFVDFSGNPLLNPGTLIYTPPFQVTNSILSNTLTPPAGAGPTGTGIPGTQPVNNFIADASKLFGPSTSLLSSIKNFFTPSAPKNISPTNYATQPGYGGAQPSFLQQSTILPGTPNSTVLIGGAVVFAVLMAFGSSGKRR